MDERLTEEQVLEQFQAAASAAHKCLPASSRYREAITQIAEILGQALGTEQPPLALTGAKHPLDHSHR